MDKKIVIIGIDVDDVSFAQIASGLFNLGNTMGYTFICTNTTNIKAINRDELHKILERTDHEN